MNIPIWRKVSYSHFGHKWTEYEATHAGFEITIINDKRSSDLRWTIAREGQDYEWGNASRWGHSLPEIQAMAVDHCARLALRKEVRLA